MSNSEGGAIIAEWATASPDDAEGQSSVSGKCTGRLTGTEVELAIRGGSKRDSLESSSRPDALIRVRGLDLGKVNLDDRQGVARSIIGQLSNLSELPVVRTVDLELATDRDSVRVTLPEGIIYREGAELAPDEAWARILSATAEAWVAKEVGEAVLQALQDFPKSAEQVFEDDTSDTKVRNNKRVINAICYAAGNAAGFWPIGTMIAGPTALGCLAMMLTDTFD